MYPHGYAGSLKCHHLFAITPTPQTGGARQESGSVSTLDLDHLSS